MKSCISLAGPTTIGSLGVEACADVSESETSTVTNMNTVDKLIIRGGTRETRNALKKERTNELIEAFLNQAHQTAESVEHTFSFGVGSSDKPICIRNQPTTSELSTCRITTSDT